MTKKYDVTVLICVHSTNYDHDFLLVKSLKSLENQTYKNFKTLLVLDECWGNTKKIITQTNFDLDIEIQEKNKMLDVPVQTNCNNFLNDKTPISFLEYINNKIQNNYY